MADDPTTGVSTIDRGIPLVDPTKNVLDLNEASSKRLDDLRIADSRRIDELRVAESRRQDEIRAADNHRIEDMAALRAEQNKILIKINADHFKDIMHAEAAHIKELMTAEAKRIDAIRVVDVQAVTTANEKATAQAAVLATQVQQSAETLRTLVATNAAALAAQLTQTITPITDRLSLLEKSSYEGAGKSGVTDPQMIQLLQEMRITREALAQGTGRTTQATEGRVNMTTIIGLTIAAAAVAASLMFGIMNMTDDPVANGGVPPVIDVR